VCVWAQGELWDAAERPGQLHESGNRYVGGAWREEHSRLAAADQAFQRLFGPDPAAPRQPPPI
jgi:hypothetical protein